MSRLLLLLLCGIIVAVLSRPHGKAQRDTFHEFVEIQKEAHKNENKTQEEIERDQHKEKEKSVHEEKFHDSKGTDNDEDEDDEDDEDDEYDWYDDIDDDEDADWKEEEALFGDDYDELEEMEYEERVEELMNLTNTHDLDHDGYITEEEMFQWILSNFKEINDAEASVFLEEVDGNSDGKVDFSEIIAALSKAELMDELDKVMEKKSFDAADLNKDGFLDEAEMPAYYDPYDYPHMHAVEVERAVYSLDSNRDGFLSLVEFVEEVKPKGHKGKDKKLLIDEEKDKNKDGVLNPLKVRQFKHLDKNGDGQLSIPEAEPWALHHNITREAKLEAKHIFIESDEDDDGILTIKEIVDNEKTFFDSVATFYGNQERDEL